MILMKRIDYTFQEILDHWPDHAPNFPHSKSFADDWFTSILDEAGMEMAIYGLSEYFTDDLCKGIANAVMTIVYERHAYDFIYEVRERYGVTHALDEAEYRGALSKVINMMNLTIPRYAVLLQRFETYSTDPTGKVTSSSTGRTRFNDTPQNGGYYNDDPHATNVSESSSESQVDSGSIMERLEATFKGFRSIIRDWADEFDPLFVKEDQIP